MVYFILYFIDYILKCISFAIDVKLYSIILSVPILNGKIKMDDKKVRLWEGGESARILMEHTGPSLCVVGVYKNVLIEQAR